MANVEIKESEMTFVVDDRRLYHIEKSALIAAMPDGTKSPEFITYNHQTKRLVMVEAKKSAPKTSNTDDFELWIGDIIEKFSTAMHLFHALSLNRHPQHMKAELGEEYGKLNFADVNYCFILVVKNHKDEWMPELMNCVKQSIKPLIRWWNIHDTNVKVINESTARDWKMII